MRRVLHIAVALCVGIVAAIGLSQGTDRTHVYRPSHPVRNLPEMSADAKSRGLIEIEAPSAIVDYPAMPGVDVLLAHFTFAAVQVRTVQPHYEDTYQTQIVSDVTFDVSEVLSAKRQNGNSNPGLPPTLTVTVYGGTVLENGVKVTQRSIPELKPDQRFIAILDSAPKDGKTRYNLAFGRNSLIALNSNDILQPSPWITSPILQKFLNDNAISSLSDFQATFKAAKTSKARNHPAV